MFSRLNIFRAALVLLVMMVCFSSAPFWKVAPLYIVALIGSLEFQHKIVDLLVEKARTDGDSMLCYFGVIAVSCSFAILGAVARYFGDLQGSSYWIASTFLAIGLLMLVAIELNRFERWVHSPRTQTIEA